MDILATDIPATDIVATDTLVLEIPATDIPLRFYLSVFVASSLSALLNRSVHVMKC
jgi:hypothetical protein